MSIVSPKRLIQLYHFMDNQNEQLHDTVEVEEELDTDVIDLTDADSLDQDDDSEENITLSKSEFKKMQRQAIAYKALKKTDNDPIIKKQINNTEVSDTDTFKEELKLLAKGYTDEAIDYLKILSKGAGVSLKEAEENELFQAFQEKQDAEKKSRKAQLGASRGSAMKKSVDMSKMSPEEHQKAWAETVSRLG